MEAVVIFVAQVLCIFMMLGVMAMMFGLVYSLFDLMTEGELSKAIRKRLNKSGEE